MTTFGEASMSGKTFSDKNKPNGTTPVSIIDATTIGATTVSWTWYPRLPA
jgi:hypothetical protein